MVDWLIDWLVESYIVDLLLKILSIDWLIDWLPPSIFSLRCDYFCVCYAALWCFQISTLQLPGSVAVKKPAKRGGLHVEDVPSTSVAMEHRLATKSKWVHSVPLNSCHRIFYDFRVLCLSLTTGMTSWRRSWRRGRRRRQSTMRKWRRSKCTGKRTRTNGKTSSIKWAKCLFLHSKYIIRLFHCENWIHWRRNFFSEKDFSQRKKFVSLWNFSISHEAPFFRPGKRTFLDWSKRASSPPPKKRRVKSEWARAESRGNPWRRTCPWRRSRTSWWKSPRCTIPEPTDKNPLFFHHKTPTTAFSYPNCVCFSRIVLSEDEENQGEKF